VSIEVVPYAPEHVEAVKAFNRRMRAGGSEWGWYEDSVPDWLAPQPGQRVWREYYLVVEDSEAVRGGFALKPQDFLIQGEPHVVTDWQGPVSEGVVNSHYNTVGLRIFREMLKRRPVLFSWGHGGYERELPRFLRSLGFFMYDTPFCLRVVRPARFLHRNRYLRSTAARRIGLDLLAGSGLGWLGLRGMHAALDLARRGARVRADAEPVDDFGEWSNALWADVSGDYSVIAVRDAEVMNALVPAQGWPQCRRLRVRRGGQDLGWVVVMESQLSGDVRFGDLRVGVLVDMLARPSDAASVIAAGYRQLAAQGVDLVFANLSHPAWVEGCARNGFLVLRKRRLFAASKPLQQLLEPVSGTMPGLHLTNMDGHGPMGL